MRLYVRVKRSGERTWWASWTEAGATKRRSTKCSSRSAAEVVVARWERERADPVYAAAQGATFGVEAGRFLKACEGAVARKRMAADTLSMYRQKSGTLVRLLGSDTRLASFDAATFPRYLDARRDEFREDRDREITESTLYKEWVTFRQILKQAWREQRFGRDPASLKPPHFGPDYQPRETALSWDQARVLLAELPSERQPTVAFALGCGARRKEVFAARPGDIDLPKSRVRIRGTKTEAAAATLPIVGLMRPWLEAAEPGLPFPVWENARRDIFAACARLDPETTKAARRAGEATEGMPVFPRVTWNDLRRTFASLLVQAGVAPHLVAKLLRHTTTAMVDRVYGRQTAESLEALIGAQLREPSVNQTTTEETVREETQRT